MRIVRLITVSCVVSLCAGLACSSGGGGGGGSGGASSGGKYSGLRSAKCLQWQDAMCDFVSDKCQFQQRPECDELYQSLFCEVDANLDPCLTALSSEQCPATPDVPATCKSLNDPAPVVDFCQEFANTLCDASVRCEGGDHAACLQELNIASVCADAVGVLPAGDQCLADLKVTSCDATEAPPSCKGVIITLNPTTGGGTSTQSWLEHGGTRWHDVTKQIASVVSASARSAR